MLDFHRVFLKLTLIKFSSAVESSSEHFVMEAGDFEALRSAFILSHSYVTLLFQAVICSSCVRISPNISLFHVLLRCVYQKMGNSQPIFLYFRLFLFYNRQIIWLIKFCGRQDSNRGSLVSDATTLPTEPQPLPQEMCILPHKQNSDIIFMERINLG